MLNKKRIHEVLSAYANQIGYPDKIGPREFTQHHLNNFFKILLMKKLVKPEHYNDYRNAVVLEYKKWAIVNAKR